jgi:hypothetical protein
MTNPALAHRFPYAADQLPVERAHQVDVELPEFEKPTMGARGAIIGVCSGAVMWAGILVLCGVIKL